MFETQSSVSDVSRVEASLNNGRESGTPPQNQSDRTSRRQQRQRQAKRQQDGGTHKNPRDILGRSPSSRHRQNRPPAASLPLPLGEANGSASSSAAKQPAARNAGGKNPSLSSSGREKQVPRLEFKSRNGKFRVSTSRGEAIDPKIMNQRRGAKAVARSLVDNPQSPSGRESPPQTQNFSRSPLGLGQKLLGTMPKGARSPNPKVKDSKIKPYQEAKLKTKTNTRTHNPPRSVSPLLYGTRLLIVGVGIGALAGTLLSALDPASRLPTGSQGVKQEASLVEANPKQPQSANLVRGGVQTCSLRSQDTCTPAPRANLALGKGLALQSSLKLSQEIPSLKPQVAALVKQNPKLQPGFFFVDLDTGAYLDSDGSSSLPAASTIKLPILVAFFQDVDAGKIRLDEQLTLKPEMVGSGSGELQYKKPGTKFTALEVVTKMIAISDNTATNMLIARLGGATDLNQRFASWGLTSTVINNALPDLEGTNTTSPKELATLMAMVNQGDAVSMQSRSRILEIMQKTVTNSMLPKGLGKGATIAHKTGDIGSLVGDVGLINTPTGKRYIAAVMVKRPHNDARAQELIRQISRVTYQYFSGEESGVSTLQKSREKPQELGVRN